MTHELQDLLEQLAIAQRRLEEADQAAAGQGELFLDQPTLTRYDPEFREWSRMCQIRDRRLVERDDVLRQVIAQAKKEGAIS
jgi:hypothetical protein